MDTLEERRSNMIDGTEMIIVRLIIITACSEYDQNSGRVLASRRVANMN